MGLSDWLSKDAPQKDVPMESTSFSNEMESRRTVVESEEYFIQELVDLEKDFEDEFFFECPEEDLEEFYEKRAQKVAKVKTVGKILDHMDEEQEVFPNPQAEGAANMIKGMSSYICETADIPNYVQKSQRTVVEQEIFQTFATKNHPEVDLAGLIFDGLPVKLVKDACLIAKRQAADLKAEQEKQRKADAKRKAEEDAALEAKKAAEEKAAKEAEEAKKPKRKVIDEAYLNNLRAMKVNIPGPSRVNVPEPFRQNERVSSSFGASKSPYGASATSRSPYSATSRASSTSSISSRYSTGSAVSSKYSTSKYSTASKYSSISKY